MPTQGGIQVRPTAAECDVAQKNNPTSKPPPRQAPKGRVVTGAAAETEFNATQREARRQQRSKGKRLMAVACLERAVAGHPAGAAVPQSWMRFSRARSTATCSRCTLNSRSTAVGFLPHALQVLIGWNWKGRHATDAPAHPERPRGRCRATIGCGICHLHVFILFMLTRKMNDGTLTIA
jgi:hypothetical protein